jgi:hypothetical protein
MSEVISTEVAAAYTDADFDIFAATVKDRFLLAMPGPLFTTDADDLFEVYLASFPEGAARQHHTCSCCRQFIQRFGALVTIDESGRTMPLMWPHDDAPECYKPTVNAMAQRVRRAKVTGVFLSNETRWGTPVTGHWHHFSVTPPAEILHHSRTLTPGQAMAEKREDFGIVMRALAEFKPATVEQALVLLRSDALYRSEKVLGQGEWLHNLHAARAEAQGDRKANVVWRAVATAPAGFCHPRSSMIGTLLEDIEAGMSFDQVSRRLADKMHPLRYQRPQAAPTAGAIEAAEKLVEKLGIQRSLPRRFVASLDEVQALWKPAPAKDEPAKGGVFGHLKPKGSDELPMSLRAPAQTMTWDKFQRTVLLTAERIEFQAPRTGAYTSLLTAVNMDAPPILQWDSEDKRNPVSWYFWMGGSTASQFGLAAGQFCQVNAITLKPSMWNGGREHQGAGVMFVIDGARETRQPQACLFPEILKSELHGVRSVIEAFSRSTNAEGIEHQAAAGVMLQKGQGWDAVLRVWTGGHSTDYRLDRWD